MAHNEPCLKVRLPHEVKAWVRKQAEAACRSMNGEIEYRLKAAMAAEQSGRQIGGEPAAGEASRA